MCLEKLHLGIGRLFRPLSKPCKHCCRRKVTPEKAFLTPTLFPPSETLRRLPRNHGYSCTRKSQSHQEQTKAYRHAIRSHALAPRKKSHKCETFPSMPLAMAKTGTAKSSRRPLKLKKVAAEHTLRRPSPVFTMRSFCPDTLPAGSAYDPSVFS